MKGKITEHQVGGRTYKVWSDFTMRGTYAEDDLGDVKRICGGGYISNDLTIRKAIAAAWKLQSFRK